MAQLTPPSPNIAKEIKFIPIIEFQYYCAVITILTDAVNQNILDSRQQGRRNRGGGGARAPQKFPTP